MTRDEREILEALHRQGYWRIDKVLYNHRIKRWLVSSPGGSCYLSRGKVDCLTIINNRQYGSFHKELSAIGR